MKNVKLTLSLLSVLTITAIHADENSPSAGEALMLAPAFVTNVGVDAVTLDQTHQTRKMIDRNSSEETKAQKRAAREDKKMNARRKSSRQDDDMQDEQPKKKQKRSGGLFNRKNNEQTSDQQ